MSTRPSLRQRVGHFLGALDERIGHRRISTLTVDRPVRPSFAHSLGAGLLFALILQVVTGIALAAHFAPTTTDAWGSVWQIEHRIVLGSYVRGLHHFGASAVVVMSLLHLIQVVVFGAYKRPREANWVIGVLMLGLIAALALTGYLLPWDQHGYWSTQVTLGIMEGTPFGTYLASAVRGGAEIGNATLTHFYALHTILIPALLGALVLVHLGLYLKHGPKPRPQRADVNVVGATKPMWPYQAVRDIVVMIVVFGVLTALALTVGATLEAPADPSSDFQARPMWYFRFLYQLLKLFEGPLVIVGTVVLPALAGLFLIAVPWLDRKSPPSLGPSKRVLVPFTLMITAVVGLVAWSMIDDAGDPAFQAAQVKAAHEAEEASTLAALGGVDGSGRVVLFSGKALYVEKGCASCHDDDKVGAPRLAGWGSDERFAAFVKNPDDARFFGHTPLKDQMPGSDLTRPDSDALHAYLRDPASGPPKGKELFGSEGCDACHNTPSAGSRLTKDNYDLFQQGPDVDGYGGYEWTRELIRDASHPRFFGDAVPTVDGAGPNAGWKAMPSYAELGPDELELLVRWLLAGAPGAK